MDVCRLGQNISRFDARNYIWDAHSHTHIQVWDREWACISLWCCMSMCIIVGWWWYFSLWCVFAPDADLNR